LMTRLLAKLIAVARVSFLSPRQAGTAKARAINHRPRAYDVIKACLQRERLACRNPPHDMERTFWAQGACPGILRSCCMMDRDKPLHYAGERACEGLGAGIQTM
jgi:hypothetical protein